MKTKINHISNIITYLILTAVAIVTIFPLIYVVLSSFKSNMELMTNYSSLFPKEFIFDNYIEIWKSDSFNALNMLKNSIIYTLVCVVSTVITSCTVGYVFARAEFPFKKTILAIFTSMMFVCFGSITIYPLFDILNVLKLSGSIYGLMITKVFGLNIVNVYLVRGFINTLPKEIDEAAEIDGCGFIRIFFTMIAPLLKPMVATIGILAFQGSWNDYLLPTLFTITKPEQRTLIVGLLALKNSEQAATSWNLMFAGTVISLIPVLFVYTIGNKFFVSGLAAGAVKG